MKIIIKIGYRIIVIKNEIVKKEDEKNVKRKIKGVMIEERIVGVEKGGCKKNEVREEKRMKIEDVEEMEEKFKEKDIVLMERGGDKMKINLRKEIIDLLIYVIEVEEGEKIKRKKGKGIRK